MAETSSFLYESKTHKTGRNFGDLKSHFSSWKQNPQEKGGLPICDTNIGYKSYGTRERVLSNADGGYRSGDTRDRALSNVDGGYRSDDTKEIALSDADIGYRKGNAREKESLNLEAWVMSEWMSISV